MNEIEAYVLDQFCFSVVLFGVTHKVEEILEEAVHGTDIVYCEMFLF